MKLHKRSISTIATAVLFSASINVANAATFAAEARSMGMANVAVATADMATAAFTNPAMLASQRRNNDFSLLIGVGGFLNDDQNVIDDIDDFQAADDANDVPEMINVINRMAGKVIAPELSAAFAFGFAGDTYAFAVSARSDLISAGTLTNINTSSPAAVNNPANNIVSFEGVVATELGLSIAGGFNVMGQELSVGIKPKIVQFDAITFQEPLLTIGDSLNDLIDDNKAIDLGDTTTMDFGLAMDLTDSLRVGLTVENLITDDFQVAGSTFKLDTKYRAGIAYHTSFMTVGIDVDLKENDPLLSNPLFNGLKTQYAAVGAEFNAFDVAQLRVGASENIASGAVGAAKDTTYYAGVGLWLGFNLDLAVALRDESLGAYLQTGFRF